MNTRSVEIAPSILSADFLRLGAQVSDAINAGVRRIHVDVMDGHFVPNLSMGPLVVGALRPLAAQAGAVLEVHLMIAEPDRYLDTFRHAPDDALAVHLARTTELEEEYLTRYPEREIDPSRLTITSRS